MGVGVGVNVVLVLHMTPTLTSTPGSLFASALVRVGDAGGRLRLRLIKSYLVTMTPGDSDSDSSSWLLVMTPDNSDSVAVTLPLTVRARSGHFPISQHGPTADYRI